MKLCTGEAVSLLGDQLIVSATGEQLEPISNERINTSF